MAITAQEAWTERANGCALRDSRLRPRGGRGGRVPGARGQARSTSGRASASGCRSARSRTWSRTPSGARFADGETLVVPRVTDIYAALPSHHRQVRARVRRRAEGRRERGPRADPRRRRHVFDGYFARRRHCQAVIEWFDLGGTLQLSRHDRRARRCWPSARAVQGLLDAHDCAALRPGAQDAVGGGPAFDFVLEGLVRAEEDQPQRRARAHRRRAEAAPRAARPQTTSDVSRPAKKTTSASDASVGRLKTH